MGNEVKKYTLTIGEITNNGVPCTNPSIEVLDGGDFSISCIDISNNTYELEGFAEQENKCVTFLVRCNDCGDCPPKEITKCICTDDSDCSDCELCGPDGFCESTCSADEFCLNDNCVECDPENPCPDGKVCKNGRCVCPQSAPFEVGGRCLECIHEDVQNCNECRDGILVPLPCSGVCDPSINDCVDCLQASDCDGDNECCVGKECQCCEGFQRNQANVCVPIPECSQDSDCSDCEQCNDGNCDPTICPEGQICLGDNGCVEECDCNTSLGCSDDTFRCDSGDNGCGCVKCQGDCESGCQDGCFCNGTECVADVCFGGLCPCSDGTDCPDGYGCNGTECVPCASLDCDSSECANVLGCRCTTSGCVDSDVGCGDSPCTVQSDCAFGCTCDDGICKSCDNYSCAECGTVAGCSCNGADCEGVEVECTDTFELKKNDTNCKLTATLNKGEECACPALTVDVLGRRISETSDNIVLEFKGELRKGAYLGDLSNPLLDNTANPNILENDSPTSGRITMVARVYFTEYSIDVNTNIRTRIGNGQQADIQIEGSFLTGNTASLVLGQLTLPKINSVEVTETDSSNRATKEVKYTRVVISAETTDNFDFPNECTYTEDTTIGTYLITNNSQYNNFGFAFTNHKATTIQSSETRLPAFRWYKSTEEGVISGAPFRKLYVPFDGSAYSDEIGKPEGVGACKYYKVLTDCSCATSPDIYGIFCNPDDLEFDVTNCGKRITIDPTIKIPCDVNQDVDFYFRAGSVYQTWLGSRWDVIAGQSFNSSSKIEEVEFGIVCDTEAACTKFYPVQDDFSALDIDLQYTCSANNTQASVVIPNFDSSLTCAIQKVEFEGDDGFFYIPGQTYTTTGTTFTYTVFWACGCDPTTKTVVVECCDEEQQTLVRNCDGTVECEHLDGYTYTINGTVITDICADAQNNTNRPIDTPYSIIRTKTNCPDQTINVAGVNCCEDFDLVLIASPISDPIYRVVGGAGESPIISPSPNGEFMQLSGTGPTEFRIVNYDLEQSYTITLTSSQGCGTKVRQLLGTVESAGPGSPGGDPEESDPSPDTPVDVTTAMGVESNSDYESSQLISPDCGNSTTLSRIADGADYTLRSTVTDLDCGCPSEVVEFRITNITDNGDGTLDVEVFNDVNNVVPTSSSTFIVDDITRGTTFNVTADAIDTLTMPKAITTTTSTTAGVVNLDVSENQPNRTFTFSNMSLDNGTFLTDLNVASSTLNIPAAGGTFVGTVGATSITYAGSAVVSFISPTVPENQVFDFVYTVNTVEGDTYVFTKPLLIPYNGVSGTSSVSFNITFDVQVETEVDIQLRLRIANLSKDNGCSYMGNTGVIPFNSGTTLTFPSNSREVDLPLSSSNSKTKFDWKNSVGTTILEEYAQSQSTLTTGLVTVGDTYSVTTECASCLQTQTLKVCPPISGNVTVDTCLENATFTLSGDTQARTYDVTFEGTTQAVAMVGGSGSTSFVQVMAESTDYTVTVALQGTAACVATFSFTTGLKDGGCP